MWVARCCRPGIAYGVSKLQSCISSAVVEDLILANKIVRHVQEDPTTGLLFRPGLTWKEHRDAEVEICVVAVSDASHGSEHEFLDLWKVREPFRSQGGSLVFIADRRAETEDECRLHLVSFKSTVQKRVVNSTIKAETYQLSDTVEA